MQRQEMCNNTDKQTPKQQNKKKEKTQQMQTNNFEIKRLSGDKLFQRRGTATRTESQLTHSKWVLEQFTAVAYTCLHVLEQNGQLIRRNAQKVHRMELIQ